MPVDFLDLIRELIIATRQESLAIDSVCDEVSFPWMAVAGMSYWQIDMPCFSHLRQAGLHSSLTQLGRSDCGCTDSTCLEGFTNTFIQSQTVSFSIESKYHPHHYVFKLCRCECIQRQIYTMNKPQRDWKPWREFLNWDSYQRARLDRCMCFFKKSDFSIVCLYQKVESKGKVMTLAGN